MVTITREGDGEREGGIRKRVVEKLRNIAATAGTVLSQKDGIVGKVVETIGSTPFAPHMDSTRMGECFVRQRRVGDGEELEMIDRKGCQRRYRREAIWRGSWHTGTIGARRSTGVRP